MRTAALLLSCAAVLGQGPAPGTTQGPAQGPAPSFASLQELLASDQPATVAWGAWRAGEYGLRAAAPDLRQALQRFVGADGDAAYYARLAVLDALVRLDETLLPAETRMHPEPGLAVPLLILAARSLEAHRDWLAERFAAADRSDRVWRVTGNLLATRPEPRFVQRCVQRLALPIGLEVRDARPDGICRCGIGCSPTLTYPPLVLPPGFPPLPDYRLDRANDCSRGEGLRLVAFTRGTLGTTTPPPPEHADEQDAYADWLWAIGGRATHAALELVERPWTQVLWTGAGAKLHRVAAAEGARRARAYAAMCAELAAAGHLPAAAAKHWQPLLQVRVHDLRSNTRRALPDELDLLRTATGGRAGSRR